LGRRPLGERSGRTLKLAQFISAGFTKRLQWIYCHVGQRVLLDDRLQGFLCSANHGIRRR
jgi:hypothetical protein